MSMPPEALETTRVDILAGLKAPTPVSKPKEATSSTSGVTNVDPRTGEPKRGRGRPPGSRNRPKEVESGSDTGTRVQIPQGPAPTVDKAEEEAKKRRVKAERAKKISDYLAGDFSEQALEMLVSGTKIPANLIFTERAATVKRSTNPNLTEFGQRFAVPPDVAEAWGKVLAEFASSAQGGKIAESFESGSAGLIIACLLCFLTTARWGRSLKEDFDKVQELLTRMAETEGQQAEGGNPLAS
jgi:hypothetical protein